MLELKDFVHLPEVDSLVQQLLTDEPGLILVAGHESRPSGSSVPDLFLPSGRPTVFGILARRLLLAHPSARAILLAKDKGAVRFTPALRRRVQSRFADSTQDYVDQIASVLGQPPEILIVDQLQVETIAAALEAARRGIRVIAQIECLFSGAGVARHLADHGISGDLFDSLRWILTVQRQLALCPHCKQPAQIDPASQTRLPGWSADISPETTFYQAGRCDQCHRTGRAGSIMALDIFRASTPPPDLYVQPSLISLEAYVMRLAMLGLVSVDDLAPSEVEQMRRSHLLLDASERALSETNAALTRKVAELEAANRVLRQRTESFIALQEITQALITSSDLHSLSKRICREVRNLCGADRSILYALRPDTTVEVLAVSGWEPNLVELRLEAMQVFGPGAGLEGTTDDRLTLFRGWPPGIPKRHPDVEGAALRAGLRILLVAENEVVGLLIAHSTQKSHFAPAELALVRTFANQAALAMQRTGLVESLQDKIKRLQAAQAELVKKERLERELELAREVQQRLLPQSFPQVPGYEFAARSEAARRVGGDFYDIFLLNEDRFGVVIADVSDKGMPAALFMALTRSLLLAEARRERSPCQVLASVHRLLLELGDANMFVTVFYAVIDRAARVMTFTRAGHEKPLLLRNGTFQALGDKGTALGLLDAGQVSLPEEQISLLPGDRLVLYTDGLTDAVGSEGQPFGLERLEKTLARHAHLAPTALSADLFSEIAAFQGTTEQYDDMALLVMDVK